ncbi:MAG: hypothetical protein ACLGH0_05070, partial [Thermoanaerobaculia bacterium]
VAARAIVWAAEHPRRELNVGWNTTRAIFGNTFIPGWLDHYLGRIGFEEQQGDEPEDPGRATNFYEYVPGDAGAHGPFSDRAKDVSPHLWTNTHRTVIGVALGALAFAALTRAAASRGSAKARDAKAPDSSYRSTRRRR